MRRKVMLALGTLTTIMIMAGCRSDDEPVAKGPTKPQETIPFKTKADFQSMVVHSKVERFDLQKDGTLILRSSGTLTITVDATTNRSRLELVTTLPADDELVIFDGRLTWTRSVGEKTILGGSPPWNNYEVWNQIRPGERGSVTKDSLRGMEMSLVTTNRGKFWYYKGVKVQFHRSGANFVLRSALRNIKENVPLPPHIFDLPEGLEKAEL